MRIMAIDYGDTRTGVAFSDMFCSMAGETMVIHERSAEKLAGRIAELIKEKDVGTVVLGYPKNMNDTAGPRAEKTIEFAGLLTQKSGIAVSLWDERLTTVDAHRILSENRKFGRKRKESIDAVSAALILEGYLAAGR